MKLNITVPTLLLDETICRKNIEKMASKALRNKITFRPHFKTHVSAEIGNWFRDYGVNKITVSSLRMAEYFARAGWDDILVAFPVNVLEISTINSLAQSVRLSLLVEATDSLLFLEKNLSSPVEIYIKTDAGYGRTGVWYEDIIQFKALLDIIKTSKKLKFRGFLTHAGQSYNARGVEEIMQVHVSTIERLNSLKGHFVNDFPDLIISTGDTPTCSVIDDFSGTDEIRPGNFVFYDCTQLVIGSCLLSDVAVALACPVVAVHEPRSEVVIYGGSVHFSKDIVVTDSEINVYGLIAQTREAGWGGLIMGASLIKLSQEHGIVKVPPELAMVLKPGDIMTIIPAHSCITASQMNRYLTTSGRYIERMLPF